MDNFILEIPDSTNYTIRDVQEIIDSQEFEGIIELYNSSDKNADAVAELVNILKIRNIAKKFGNIKVIEKGEPIFLRLDAEKEVEVI